MTIKTKEEALEEKKARIASEVAYKSRDESELTKEQLTDPDYRLKSLQTQSLIEGRIFTPSCSKCHHCRR